MTTTIATPTGRQSLAVRVLALLLAVTILAGFASQAGATTTTDSATAPQTTTDWATLHAIAQRDGAVPVIVTLDAPAKLPHTLSAAALKNQKASIVRARNDLKRQLGNAKLRVLKTMDDLPLMSFHASAADVAVLQHSDRVLSVTLDQERLLPAPKTKGNSKPIADVAPDGTVQEGDTAPAGTSSNGLHNQLTNWWDYYRIGVDRAVAAGYQGTGQVVAVLDTGVDRYHNWLQGDVVAEACFALNTSQTGGTCPNGSHYQYGFGAAAPCRQTACDHGTHVAHTAAGAYGVAPGARVIAVQVFHPTSKGPSAWDSDITWGLKFVYDLRTTYRIAAVNMSLGSGGYGGYCDNNFAAGTAQANVLGWMKALAKVGIATVVASGNDNYSRYVSQPACFSTAISVGNTTLTSGGADAVFGNGSYVGTDGRTYVTGSNSNSTLDLLAPGTDICSAVPGNRYDCTKGGTSMAAPHVAGAIAVLRQSRPAATIQQVVNALHQSGASVYDGRNGITRSRINVYRALGIIHKM